MRLAVLALAACASSPPAALANHATHVTCDVPKRLELPMRRYGNLDATDPAYNAWTPWTLTLDLDVEPPIMHNEHGHVRQVRGHAILSGDGLLLDFPASGAVACETHRLALDLEEHEPYSLELDLTRHIGMIQSIDDRFVIGDQTAP